MNTQAIIHQKRAHQRGGAYLKDMIYGANDGIITTFAIIAGVVGAALPTVTIVLLGIANVLADGFSMATSNYLGTKSERDFFKRERRVEQWEVAHIPEEERAEIRAILAKKGYSGNDLERLTDLIVQNEDFWVDFMMHEELRLSSHGDRKPSKHALATFFAFIAAGILPIAPYVFLSDVDRAFQLTVFGTAVALFLVGALRSAFTEMRWARAGFEMLFVGGIAAAIAFLAGFLMRRLIE